MLAGLSVDYLIRLEQGRVGRPSEQVVAALARALQLSDFERDQLYIAAGLPPPAPGTVPVHIPASVQRLLARLPDVAVSVYTTHWTLLTANAAWVAMFGPVDARNLVLMQFTGTGMPVVRSAPDIKRFERALVSDLRAAVIRYPADESVRSLVNTLQGTSDRFAQLWSEGTMAEHRSEQKTFVHPLVGNLTVDCDIFAAIGTDLRILTYTAAPGTEDATKFDLIRTIGTSELNERSL